MTSDADTHPKESMINASQSQQSFEQQGSPITPETILAAIVERASDRNN